jgi:selenocysteine-specific elongation factor
MCGAGPGIGVSGRDFVVATAGHVDHGKSTVVKALTGTDPDRLPEEKARQITIDLGFAHLLLDDGGKPDGAKLSLSIIDVPGHEDFVRNMIAGLGSIDLVLLVVAADDGWMPQTEEHLQILDYLRVPRMIVAINKCDAVQPNNTIQQVRAKLHSTRYADAPVVPVSARSNLGLEHLKQAFRDVLKLAQPQRDIGKSRLFVDRAFTLAGIGPVITGTLTGGRISASQNAYLQPGNFQTRVRSVQTRRSNLAVALPGTRAGINLTEVPKGSDNLNSLRGFVLTSKPYSDSTVVDVVIERSARLQPPQAAARPLKSGTSVYVHYATRRASAIVTLAAHDPLQPGQHAIGQLRFADPVLAFLGDRFVLRDRSEQSTIAGGMILDPHGTVRKFRTAEHQKSLTTRLSGNLAIPDCVQAELMAHGPIPTSELLKHSNFSDAEIERAVKDLKDGLKIIVSGEIAADAVSWQSLANAASELVDDAHKARPEQQGLELTKLRSEMRRVSAETMEALIDDLCGRGFVRRGTAIARASHRPTLPPELESSAEQIFAILDQRPLDPPGRDQITPDQNRRQAARYLIEQGELVELGPDLFLSRPAFGRAKQIVIEVLNRKGSATVSELREAMQTSRRIAVPLLERLDRERITRREGDKRILFSVTPGPLGRSQG